MNFDILKDKAAKKGINEIEIYKVNSKGINIETFDQNVDKIVRFNTNSMAIRGVYNNKITTIYSECDSDLEIDKIIEDIIDNCSNITKDEPYFLYKGDLKYPNLIEKKHDFENFSLDYKKELCLKLEKIIKNESKYIKNTSVSYEENEYEYSITNTSGLNVFRKSREAIIVGEAILEFDGETKTNYDYDFINVIDEIDLNSLAKKIVDRTAKTFKAKSLPSSSYNVILENKVMCSILGAFSGIFSAKNVLRKLSFLEGKLNEKIFGDNVTIIDDPLNNFASMQNSFDDEGVACYTKSVVENGILKTYLHNLTTAKMMNSNTTGNGYKSSTKSPVEVSSFNMYLKQGNTEIIELYKKANNGVLITNVTGLHAGIDEVSGSFNLQASGFTIENGVITKPVTLIIISGNFKDLLNNIIEISSDFIFRGTFGSASVLVKNLKISGE